MSRNRISSRRNPYTAGAMALALSGMLGACIAQPQTGNQTSAATANTQATVLDFQSCAKPQYPEEELQAGHEGTVKLAFLVKADGSIGGNKVLVGSGFPALDEAARLALAECRFRPATRNGQPFETWTDITYVWTKD